jgi:hypothetical protein
MIAKLGFPGSHFELRMPIADAGDAYAIVVANPIATQRTRTQWRLLADIAHLSGLPDAKGSHCGRYLE